MWWVYHGARIPYEFILLVCHHCYSLLPFFLIKQSSDPFTAPCVNIVDGGRIIKVGFAEGEHWIRDAAFLAMLIVKWDEEDAWVGLPKTALIFLSCSGYISLMFLSLARRCETHLLINLRDLLLNDSRNGRTFSAWELSSDGDGFHLGTHSGMTTKSHLSSTFGLKSAMSNGSMLRNIFAIVRGIERFWSDSVLALRRHIPSRAENSSNKPIFIFNKSGGGLSKLLKQLQPERSRGHKLSEGLREWHLF